MRTSSRTYPPTSAACWRSLPLPLQPTLKQKKRQQVESAILQVDSPLLQIDFATQQVDSAILQVDSARSFSLLDRPLQALSRLAWGSLGDSPGSQGSLDLVEP